MYTHHAARRLRAYPCHAEWAVVGARHVFPVPEASPEMAALMTSGLTASIALEQAGGLVRAVRQPCGRPYLSLCVSVVRSMLLSQCTSAHQLCAPMRGLPAAQGANGACDGGRGGHRTDRRAAGGDGRLPRHRHLQRRRQGGAPAVSGCRSARAGQQPPAQPGCKQRTEGAPPAPSAHPCAASLPQLSGLPPGGQLPAGWRAEGGAEAGVPSGSGPGVGVGCGVPPCVPHSHPACTLSAPPPLACCPGPVAAAAGQPPAASAARRRGLAPTGLPAVLQLAARCLTRAWMPWRRGAAC